jgi:EmrB/QacA subfamily drug resistance transporter
MSHAAPADALATHSELRADPRRWRALVLLCLAQFMLILDVTVVNVALPDMGADLALDRQTLTWVVTGYTLAFGGLMLLGGRLADALGARRTLLAGLVLFTAASLVTGLSTGAPTVLTGRILQGVGAALLSPAALSIITTTFHGTERNRALGIWAAIGGSGSAFGVLLGGLLTAGPGWEWVFFINVPVGVVVLALVPLAVPAGQSGHRTGGRVDLPGALSVTAGTALLIYALVRAGDSGWASAATLGTLAAALLSYAVFVAIERATTTPLMRVDMLTRRPVLAGTFLMLVASGLFIGFFFLSSLYLQHTRGFTALRTGLLFLPVAVAVTVGAHVGGRLIGRIGARPVAAAGLLLTAAGAGLLTQISADSSAYAVLLPGLVVASIGIGPVFVAATTTAMAFVPPRESGLASGLVNTFHELGGAVGVAVVSTIAAGSITAGVPTAAGFADAFTAGAVAAAVAAVAALALVPAGRPAFTGGPHVH